jgi:RNA polymerase sigma-70 factor (ECF subfamily)
MNETPRTTQQDHDTPAPTDEQLILNFSKGDTQAFTELFQRYKQPIFGFFRRRVSQSAPAEELTQETFLAVLRGAARYRPQALFRTYLYAIAFKILRAHRRRAAFRATFFGEWKRAQDPAARAHTEAVVVLRQALGKLEPTDREILLLREFEQLSYAEIAELLNIPLNTVRSRLFRARLALKMLLEQPARVAVVRKLAEFEEQA